MGYHVLSGIPKRFYQVCCPAFNEISATVLLFLWFKVYRLWDFRVLLRGCEGLGRVPGLLEELLEPCKLTPEL